MENKFQLFDSSNKIEYLNLIHNLNLKLDVYYYPSFLVIDANIQGGEYEIFVLIESNEIFIYPYIKLPFKEAKFSSYFDITSPYGYCGPYSSSESIFEKGEKLFTEYISKNCVTEFIRYHYLYNEKRKFKNGIQNHHNRTVVTLNLVQDWETIWSKEFSGTNRNLIRKMEKEGYDFILTDKQEDLESFISMYYDTMKNAGASDFYFFKNELIHRLYNELGDKIFLVKVEKDNIVYSYSLFLTSGGIGTYYLSARNFEYPKVPSTNYLLGKSVAFLQEKGCEIVNFGGGLNNEISDYLFKFKRNFSKETKEFYIGKRIYNKEIYNQIIAEWVEINGNENYNSVKHILQFYR